MTAGDLTNTGGNLPATDATNMNEMMKSTMDHFTQHKANKTTKNRLDVLNAFHYLLFPHQIHILHTAFHIS